MSAPGRATAAWLGEPVALTEVERTLERQRRELEEPGHVRARVATLLVVTDDEEQARSAVGVIQAVEGRNPSRCVVLLVRPPESGAGVRAWVRATPRRGRGPAGLRDEVIVEAAVPPGHLAAVVLPLLLSEIPVFTWWLGTPPLGTELVEQLAAVTDRLIVDSATFADPLADLARLAGSIPSLPPSSDCAWGRLTPWREMLAASFEATPLRSALGWVTQVRIAAVQPTAGALLAGWLAARLGWAPGQAEPGGRIARYRARSGPVTVHLDQAKGPNALASVQVDATAGPPEASVLLEASGPYLIASVQVGQTGHRQVRVGQCGMSAAQALRGELEVFGRDRSYEEAMASSYPAPRGG